MAAVTRHTVLFALFVLVGLLATPTSPVPALASPELPGHGFAIDIPPTAAHPALPPTYSNEPSPYLLGAYSWGGTPGDPPRRLILVSIDTLRADHLGTYGYTRRNTSPSIDRFAEDSIVFENAITPATYSLPAHASVFTGTVPRVHGTLSENDTVPDRLAMLAELFSRDGYATAAFTGGSHVSARYGFGRGFDTYGVASGDRAGIHLAANFADATSWLDRHRDSRSFVFVHGYDLHGPYAAPEPYTRFFAPKNYSGPMEDALYENDFLSDTSRIVRELDGTPYLAPRTAGPDYSGDRLTRLTPEDIAYARDAYDSTLRYVDAQFGRFIRDLKTRGLYEDAVIVVMGDHGENLGDRPLTRGKHMFGHTDLWDFNIHVPLLVRIPGVEPTRVKTPASLIDIAPTLLDAAGLTVDRRVADQLQGRSLLAMEADERRFVVAEDRRLVDAAVRGTDWKLIQRVGAPNQLLNVSAPGQEQAVPIQDNSAVYTDLLSHLRSWNLRIISGAP